MDENHWTKVFDQTIKTLANVAYNMDLKDLTSYLETMASHVQGMMPKDEEAAIDALTAKLLKCGQLSNDVTSWREMCIAKPWLQTRYYQVTQQLQIQMLKAHQAHYLWYEILHLMLEQRDYWQSSDVLWLLVMASEYIDEHSSVLYNLTTEENLTTNKEVANEVEL